jgi:RNA polymerase sigma factor (sigma-70 family)
MGRPQDEKRKVALTAAQRRLVTEHLYVVTWVLAKMQSELRAREHRGGDPDDPPAWGNFGLTQAAQTYEVPAQAQADLVAEVIAEFETFAWWRVRGAVRDELRRELRIRLHEVLESAEEAANEHTVQVRPSNEDEEDSLDSARRQIEENMGGCAAALFTGMAAAARFTDPETTLIHARAWATLEQRIVALPDRQRTLVERRLFRGQPWEVILAETGLKKGTAERHYARAMERLFVLMQAPSFTGAREAVHARP